MKDVTIFSGMVVSQVSTGDKGVGMKVMCHELRDTYRVFVPKDKMNGEQNLNMGDPVKIHYTGMYASNSEVRLNVVNILKDNGKS